MVHHAQNCVACGREFTISEVEKIVSKRQVFDIPPPKIEVTEHRLGEITCCGRKQVGENLKEQGKGWAVQIKELLLAMFKESEKGTKVLNERKNWEEKYEEICRTADNQEPLPTKSSRGRPKNSLGRNLLNRLKKHQAGVLAFAFEEEVPRANNQAERDLRCLKVKQKVSNTFRTMKGAENYARIQGFISTIRKHNLNVFEELTNVFDGVPIIFQTSK